MNIRILYYNIILYDYKLYNKLSFDKLTKYTAYRKVVLQMWKNVRMKTVTDRY